MGDNYAKFHTLRCLNRLVPDANATRRALRGIERSDRIDGWCSAGVQSRFSARLVRIEKTQARRTVPAEMCYAVRGDRMVRDPR